MVTLSECLLERSLCCCEIGSVQLKKEESELKVACINEHEGFTGVKRLNI